MLVIGGQLLGGWGGDTLLRIVPLNNYKTHHGRDLELLEDTVVNEWL